MRKLSTMHAKDLRELNGDGLRRCQERITAAQLLDRCDAATSLDELRAVVSDLITRVTGER